jgi:myo-inositol-1(or 4)-monophosphatase
MNNQLLNTAREAAWAGVRVLSQLWNQAHHIEEKSKNDFVTEADKASEKAILSEIQSRYPDHLILAEESAKDWNKEALYSDEHLWVVDPLDGTSNFIHGFPCVAVSVAVLRHGQPLAGVVVDVSRKEEFAALKGKGAWVDGNPMRVSRISERGRSLVLTGFPFRQKHKLETYLGLFSQIFQEVSGIRRAGAAALDLAFVAAGRAEGFWETGLLPWDVAAGSLLITEAGGMISDYYGGNGHLTGEQVVAGNPHLHEWLRGKCQIYFG